MLLAAVTLKAATALSLLLSVNAAAQDCAKEPTSTAIARDSIQKSIFEPFTAFTSIVKVLYGKLLNDCLKGNAGDKFDPNFRMMPGLDVDADSNRKQNYLILYMLSCENPNEVVDRLISADPTYKRYELLYDLIDNASTDLVFLMFPIKISEAGKEESQKRWQELMPSVLEQLREKIAAAVSVRPGEQMKGVFTADTVVDAYLHLLRRSSLFNDDTFYDDLSDLLASAAKSGDCGKICNEFIIPLIVRVINLYKEKRDHEYRCLLTAYDSIKSVDMARAKEACNYKRLLHCLLVHNVAKFVEVAAEMEIDPLTVTRRIIDYYRCKPHIIKTSEAALRGLSAYYLDVSEADGRTRLRKIVDDSDLMSRLPNGLVPRLLEDCKRLRTKYPEEADYLMKGLEAYRETAEMPWHLSETSPILTQGNRRRAADEATEYK
ncbi:hypothetical protein PAPHI01_0962 [Pancytospora philotis]|nr:hypothetical protein PAPHI01_0962 [Pancytospora philotis]